MWGTLAGAVVVLFGIAWVIWQVAVLVDEVRLRKEQRR